MMNDKKLIIHLRLHVLLLILIPFLAIGQKSGIKFESGLSWKDIKVKAKNENKYIFIDCFATWCGPCKYMNKNIFPIDEVGDYFNTHFISVKVQMDKTIMDSDIVKQWYVDAKSIGEDYSVNSFPTYLFFSPDGQIVHRIIGASKEGKEFVAKAAEALDSAKQYYTSISHYKEHISDSFYLRKLLEAAINASDDKNLSVIGNLYAKSIKNIYTKENLELLWKITKSTLDEGFKVFSENGNKIDEILGKKFAEGVTRNIIYREEIAPIYLSGAQPANWKLISNNLYLKYPTHAKRIITESKPQYFKYKKQWVAYEKAVLVYMKEFGSQLGDYEVNNLAWDVFLHINNKKLLAKAIVWSRRTIANYPKCDWENADTYANLLYKNGDKENAIIWEKKAIEIAQIPLQRKEFEATLAKFQKGEKTW